MPIGIRSGEGGGYSIDSRRWLPTIVLTPGEAAALVAALTAVGPRTSATGQSAMSKPLAVLCAHPTTRKEQHG